MENLFKIEDEPETSDESPDVSVQSDNGSYTDSIAPSDTVRMKQTPNPFLPSSIDYQPPLTYIHTYICVL
jgi:hypothetical protein